MNIRDLRIDPSSLGRKKFLVDVRPAYDYKDGKRTETVTGYRYEVALPELGFEKLTVRIDGEQQMQKPEEGFAEVEFSGLVIGLYEKDGHVNLSAKAMGITPVGRKQS
jgi:hypothetical protein